MTKILPHSGFIKDGEHRYPIRVYYEDTDAGGIVYHANYLKYLERARTEMLRLLGVDQGKMLAFKHADDVQFVLRRAEVDYLGAARLDDVLMVHSRVVKVAGASFMVMQEILRDAEILNKALIKIGILGKEGRPVRIPAGMKEKFND